MLCIFWKSNSSGVRDHWHSEPTSQPRNAKCFLLLCHEKNSQYFVDTTKTTSINLRDVDRFCLEHLLPDNSVLTLFSSSNANVVRFKLSTNSCMTQDIIRRCRFLYKPGFILGELFHVLDCFRYVPDLDLVNL